jgi:hypothetical protein
MYFRIESPNVVDVPWTLQLPAMYLGYDLPVPGFDCPLIPDRAPRCLGKFLADGLAIKRAEIPKLRKPLPGFLATLEGIFAIVIVIMTL